MSTVAIIKPIGPAEIETHEAALTAFHGGLPSIERMKERMAYQKEMRKMLTEYVRAEMNPALHFYTIPGSAKPALSQDGARMLCTLYEVHAEDTAFSEELEPDGHYTVRATVRLRSMATGTLVAEGTGRCSTHESKYAYRWMYDNEIPGSVRKADCDKRQRGNKWQYKVPNPDLADTYNCVTPDTRLLTHDLRWVAAGEIQTGDMLIGVEEQMDSQYARHFALGKATVYGMREDLVYEVQCEDGRTVRCNGEHQWLVKKVGHKGTEWVSTQDIYSEISERKGRPRHWCIMSVCAPWAEDTSKEAGYLAGLLDADGSLGRKNAIVMFAQQDNIVLHRLTDGMDTRQFDLSMQSQCKTDDQLAHCTSKEQVYGVRVRGGLIEQMRLLGSMRPPRLLERWLTLIDLSKRRLEGKGSGTGSPVRIKTVTIVGKEPIVLLGSSCATYIAEGMVCHNTVLKMAEKRGQTAAVLRLPCAPDVFSEPGAEEEEREKDETADRKELMGLIVKWTRTLPAGTKNRAFEAVLGVPYDKMTELSLGALDTGYGLAEQASTAQIDWKSKTLKADLAALHTRSAEQAVTDLYGDGGGTNPTAPQTPTTTDAPRTASSPTREGAAWETLRASHADPRLPDAMLEQIQSALEAMLPPSEREVVGLADSVLDWLAKSEE